MPTKACLFNTSPHPIPIQSPTNSHTVLLPLEMAFVPSQKSRPNLSINLALTSPSRDQAWRHPGEAWVWGLRLGRESRRRRPLPPSTWSGQSGLHMAPGWSVVWDFPTKLENDFQRLSNKTWSRLSNLPWWCKNCTHSFPQTPSWKLSFSSPHYTILFYLKF